MEKTDKTIRTNFTEREKRGMWILVWIVIVLIIGIGVILQECRQAKIDRILDERYERIYGPDRRNHPPRPRPVN